MTSISYPVFIEKNMEPLLPNVTHTAAEWMQLVSDIHQAQYEAVVIGLIVGFVIGMVALKAGIWWRNRGNS